MTLVKAWDKSALIEDLKTKGLPVAETAVEAVLQSVMDWTKASLLLEGGLYAGVGLPLLAVAEPLIKSEVDKIDGQPG